jgi:transposase
MKWRKYWNKNTFMIPAPRLVGVELNPGPALSDDQRKEILTLHNKAGFGSRRIAETLKIGRRTVQRVLKKYQENETVKNLPGQGRKRKTTREMTKKIKAKAKRRKSAPQIARDLSQEVPGGISETTVRRRLKEMGGQYLVIKKLEELSPDQEQRRLQFARARKDHTWRYELFVDEKSWEIGVPLQKCWQFPNNRVTDERKRHPPKIHCWGGIGYHFKTRLYFFKKNLNADLYGKILRNRLPPEYRYNLNPSLYNKWILVQDNDPKHKSKIVTELLDDIAPDRIKDFPANSPDFNPIEDIWSFMQTTLQYKKIKDIPALKRHLTEIWNNLDMNVIRASVESLPKRMAECIKRKGKRTDY